MKNLTGEYPRIERSAATGQIDVSYDFSFEGVPQHVGFTVERAVLDGARSAVRYVSYPEGHPPTDLEARSNLPYIVDPQEEPFFDAALAQLRAVRSRLQLDDDRYFELLTTFVQSLPYDEHGSAGGRFPIEVLVDRTGDCDEKSRLLAGLAAREGYAVALLSFEAEQHMAVGVRAAKLDYRGTGYAFVEATVVSIVTHPFADTSKLNLRSVPTVIPVGAGTLQYGAADEINYIVVTHAELKEKITKEDEALRVEKQELDQMNAELARISSRIERLRATHVAEANEAVRAYNVKVAIMSNQIASSKATIARRNGYVELYNLYSDTAMARSTLVLRLRAGAVQNP